MIKGIDIARYEPKIDWQKVIAGGYRFAFIKCSQATFNDFLFSIHWNDARNAGIPRAAYHFYDPSKPPEEQAEFFYNSLHGDTGELPFIVDIEGFTSGPYHGSENWYRFLVQLSKISNNHPIMIYTAYYYWIDHVMDKPHVEDVSYFGKYPIWIADYKVLKPSVPYPWNPNWLFWQYSEEGIVDGITDQLGRPTECDLNQFFGTEEQFQFLLDGMPFNGGTMPTYYLATGNATIRTGPASSYPQVTVGEPYVLTNDIIESIVPQQNGWANIHAIYRNNVKMLVATPDPWCTAAYLRVTTYVPPVDPTPPPVTDDVDFKLYRNDVLIYHIIGKEQPL